MKDLLKENLEVNDMEDSNLEKENNAKEEALSRKKRT